LTSCFLSRGHKGFRLFYENWMVIFTQMNDIKSTDKSILMKRQEMVLAIVQYKGCVIIMMTTPYSKALNKIFINRLNARWSSSHKAWILPYSEENGGLIRKAFEGQVNINDESLKSGVIKINEAIRREKIKEKFSGIIRELEEKLKVKRYSESTLKTYKTAFMDFLIYNSEADPEHISEEEIKQYLLHLVKERKVSSSYQNQAVNAIKFYLEHVCGGERKSYYIDRPLKERKLPTVLSEGEIKKILENVTNLKHKAILYTIYSAGLRVSEAINLKVGDIDSGRKIILIRGGKGKKDRISILSDKLIQILRCYYKAYKPEEFLFEGQNKEIYSAVSMNNILKKACRKAAISKKVSIHTLRHSFATHLLEHGTDIRYIQNLLGHNSTKTTEIYTHITRAAFDKIKSPLDNIDI
jgi:integrase/recombinase XerD